MYAYKNIPRFVREKSISENNNHETNAETGESLSAASNTSSTSALSNQQHTAGYLWSLSRPPLEDGMQVVTDPLFQRFLQGDIPNDHNDRLQIAKTCI
ncbi:MAG TPA: hypothetical protein VF797_03510, partial [Noviherbaspirillum sp.]